MITTKVSSLIYIIYCFTFVLTLCRRDDHKARNSIQTKYCSIRRYTEKRKHGWKTVWKIERTKLLKCLASIVKKPDWEQRSKTEGNVFTTDSGRSCLDFSGHSRGLIIYPVVPLVHLVGQLCPKFGVDDMLVGMDLAL